MITLSNVSKAYTEDVAIGPVNIQIPAGGITALVGPNGAGKSTLLTMIGRLLSIDSGTVEIGSMDVTSAKSKDLAKIISILRQENHFVTRLTVRQLVGFGRFPYTQGRLNAEDEEIISKYIDFLGLRGLEGRYLDQLSGGQRQRAYVAMVLCQETDYVLLDEPLNNLDIAHSVEMMKHLYSAAKEFGRTIIIVLHDINFAARYADYICAAKDGQIAAFGTPDEIMRDELLTKIFNTPVKVIEGPHGPLATYH
ncbi:iron ABC transporter ATP-binding protein [Corynebacterium imitans]|uniref:Iron ABC transporter ATP-binding protein n=1 Tax=Corynebacterium imitans TaxID=156978 RepID=A0A076NLJ2_9CORY|nr:ATP-binding cassette domain-containing protein [Corynebacterium imitans]AIJ33046.1 iron ABC transporter ATP-binding protein [Corynebacterium imitans]MCG7279661.1 ATP-binding cassette domain-containing protein [Corynebacterium imitans]MDK8307168.1 ATP-binding cassette domain-containing protein [Corynebacterium imitans]MDK8638424.1 ATP-binding cassette domain-containing protein [Corynebacterium imitans]MDK8773348.1 ATP-binding cassette domain-containing protein [Corynebacterium imitans]